MLNGLKILIVDDNVVNQKIAGFMLKKLDAEVDYALNGDEAVNLLRANEFDVVLMDLQMPGMDGFQTTAHIRNILKSEVPIIALTADIFVGETNACIDAGMNGCIAKPFDPEQIGKLILSVNKKSINNLIK